MLWQGKNNLAHGIDYNFILTAVLFYQNALIGIYAQSNFNDR